MSGYNSKRKFKEYKKKSISTDYCFCIGHIIIDIFSKVISIKSNIQTAPSIHLFGIQFLL